MTWKNPIIFTALLISPSLSAGDFRLDTTLLGQIRENEGEATEGPVNGYLGLGIGATPWDLSVRTNMRLFRDLSREWDDYDLYQAVLHIRPLEILQVDLGRQFVNEGFSVAMADALKLRLTPPGYVDITLFSGIPRSVEVGDFNRDDGLLSGLSVGLKNVARTNAQIHAAWRKNAISFNNLKENDEILVGTNLSHQFTFATRPFLYGLVEYNVAAKVLEAGTAGADLYPHDRISLNLEFNYFNSSRDFNRPTILSLFSRGRLLTGRLASTWTLVPDLLDLVESYSYQRIEVQDNVRRHGHLADTALQFSWEEIGLHAEPGYYFAKSFGGDLHGVRGSLHEQFTEKLYAELGIDFTTYDKITGDDDNAFSTILWSGYEILKGWTVSAGFEYNRNNLLTRDIRGSFKLDYHYGRKI